jgi:hypothetical protein
MVASLTLTGRIVNTEEGLELVVRMKDEGLLVDLKYYNKRLS